MSGIDDIVEWGDYVMVVDPISTFHQSVGRVIDIDEDGAFLAFQYWPYDEEFFIWDQLVLDWPTTVQQEVQRA